jgi:hypothetical protein
MPSILAWAGQAAVYAAAAAVVGYFASSPAYQQVPEGLAQIKISFRHGGVRVEDCKKLTSEETAKLPANKRRANTCARERVPVVVEIRVDGNVAYAEVLQPTGLSGDGPSETYDKILVPAGPHRIEARLRDSKRSEGFDYEKTADVVLQPFQNLAIDFKADRGGFLLR